MKITRTVVVDDEDDFEDYEDGDDFDDYDAFDDEVVEEVPQRCEPRPNTSLPGVETHGCPWWQSLTPPESQGPLDGYDCASLEPGRGSDEGRH